MAVIAPNEEPLIPWTFGLVGIHVVLGLIWSVALISATRSFAGVLRRHAVISWMGPMTVMIFMAFATKLALSRN